jgi:CheY-like chemotaxis protein
MIPGSTERPIPSLMIVDDEPDIRYLLRHMAEQANWGVAAEACSGQEALELWRDCRPDVIILDHRMPGISGLETAERILAEDPDQAIVLFTAFRDSAVEEAAAALKIRACLAKSELDGLMTELWACIDRGPAD